MGSVYSALQADVQLGAALAILVAALIRGFAGFGFALAAVPLLGFFLPPSHAVPLAVGLQLCGGLADLRYAHRSGHWPSLKWLIAGAMIGSPIGVLVLAIASPAAARLAIALACMVGTLALARGFNFPRVPSGHHSGWVGFAAGLFNGLAAMPGPPVVAYYLAMPLTVAQIRASLLIFFLACSLTSAASLVIAGMIHFDMLPSILIGLPLMLLGSWAGEQLFKRSSASRHRAISLFLLATIAVMSGLQALSGFVAFR
ncbi:sulfite exporter TauE/SafE family protein [Methylobacterium durans]|uniref:sulfite exporter TauE/SafE family protein n=1 Tax=Methylobacterium durans TaxID=2202825 RepID=UPI0013A59DAF|nr:sulfite exporter TauE/SafE family protein [Methylobacterium durans]